MRTPGRGLCSGGAQGQAQEEDRLKGLGQDLGLTPGMTRQQRDAALDRLALTPLLEPQVAQRRALAESGDSFSDFPVSLGNGRRLCFTVEPAGLQVTRAALKPSDKAHYKTEVLDLDGLAIHSDNWQALNLLREKDDNPTNARAIR